MGYVRRMVGTGQAQAFTRLRPWRIEQHDKFDQHGRHQRRRNQLDIGRHERWLDDDLWRLNLWRLDQHHIRRLLFFRRLDEHNEQHLGRLNLGRLNLGRHDDNVRGVDIGWQHDQQWLDEHRRQHHIGRLNIIGWFDDVGRDRSARTC